MVCMSAGYVKYATFCIYVILSVCSMRCMCAYDLYMYFALCTHVACVCTYVCILCTRVRVYLYYAYMSGMYAHYYYVCTLCMYVCHECCVICMYLHYVCMLGVVVYDFMLCMCVCYVRMLCMFEMYAF